MIDGDVTAPAGRTTSTERVGRPVRPHATARHPLATRAEELVGLIKEVESKPKPRAVHHLRTTIRRIETLLPEVQVEPSRAERKLQKQLDRIRKRAGKVRDTDVHLEALASLARRAKTTGLDEIRDTLEATRGKREKKLQRVLDQERDRGVVKRLRRVVARAVGTSTSRPGAEDGTIGRVIDRFAEALAAATPLDAANLHEFRIQTKRLRYLAETAPDPDAARVVNELKRAQDAIGTWHDWLTLAERAARALGTASATPVLAVIETHAATRLAKALDVTVLVGRRLQTLRAKGLRKGVHSMTATTVVPRNAGASA